MVSSFLLGMFLFCLSERVHQLFGLKGWGDHSVSNIEVVAGSLQWQREHSWLAIQKHSVPIYPSTFRELNVVVDHKDITEVHELEVADVR